jgi:hypothetical protein
VLEKERLAQAADDASEISAELIERVFRVRARWWTDRETGDGAWRFSSRG